MGHPFTTSSLFHASRSDHRAWQDRSIKLGWRARHPSRKTLSPGRDVAKGELPPVFAWPSRLFGEFRLSARLRPGHLAIPPDRRFPFGVDCFPSTGGYTDDCLLLQLAEVLGRSGVRPALCTLGLAKKGEHKVHSAGLPPLEAQRKVEGSRRAGRAEWANIYGSKA